MNKAFLYKWHILYLGKPDLFTHEFWPIFQTLNPYNSLDITYNDKFT